MTWITLQRIAGAVTDVDVYDMAPIPPVLPLDTVPNTLSLPNSDVPASFQVQEPLLELAQPVIPQEVRTAQEVAVESLPSSSHAASLPSSGRATSSHATSSIRTDFKFKSHVFKNPSAESPEQPQARALKGKSRPRAKTMTAAKAAAVKAAKKGKKTANSDEQ